MSSNYVTKNEMSVIALEPILRRMGGQLIMSIIDDRRIKHSEIEVSFHTFRERQSLGILSNYGRNGSTDSSHSTNSRTSHIICTKHMDVKDWDFPKSKIHFDTHGLENGNLFCPLCL